MYTSDQRYFLYLCIWVFLSGATACESLRGDVSRNEFNGLSRRVDTLEEVVIGKKTEIAVARPLLPEPNANDVASARMAAQQPQGAGTVQPVQPLGAPPANQPAAVPALAAVADDKTLYQQGQSYLKTKQYDKAAQVFTRMLEQTPNGQLAPNARYWLGECHYASGRFNEAATEFQRCASDYPESAKAPDALLKLSFSYDRLGDGPGAMTVLDVLLSRYPSSSAAALVKSGRGRFST
jgi:tol-pal system protein YbgF